MHKVITEQQKREIEKLATDGHYDALIGFGADMYQRGMIKGGILATVGMIGVVAVEKVVKVIKRKKSQKTEDESQK